MKELPLMKTAEEDKGYGAANRTSRKRLLFQFDPSDADTEPSTFCLVDTEQIIRQPERQIFGITSNEQRRCKKEFPIPLIEFEAWWEIIDIQLHQKTDEQCVIQLG
jgi:hypothetical protein